MWAAVRRDEGITDPPLAGRLVGESFIPLLEHEIADEWVRENAAELIPNPPRVTEGHVVASATA